MHNIIVLEINLFLVITCLHNGTVFNATTCVCTAQYSGAFCEICKKYNQTNLFEMNALLFLVSPRNCYDIYSNTESGSMSPGLYNITLTTDERNHSVITVYCSNGFTTVQKYEYFVF